jgi:tRNA(adenine34) deaminase
VRGVGDPAPALRHAEHQPGGDLTDNADEFDPVALMRLAMDEAAAAEAEGEVPIGAVIYHRAGGTIIGRGSNRRERDHDPSAHAEIVAMRQAATTLRSWRLLDCVMIVTLEPCAMCAGAIVNARIPALIYGCDDPKAGAVRSLYTLCEDERLNHRVHVTAGVLSDECGEVLSAFFKKQRALGKK